MRWFRFSELVNGKQHMWVYKSLHKYLAYIFYPFSSCYHTCYHKLSHVTTILPYIYHWNRVNNTTIIHFYTCYPMLPPCYHACYHCRLWIITCYHMLPHVTATFLNIKYIFLFKKSCGNMWQLITDNGKMYGNMW